MNISGACAGTVPAVGKDPGLRGWPIIRLCQPRAGSPQQNHNQGRHLNVNWKGGGCILIY